MQFRRGESRIQLRDAEGSASIITSANRTAYHASIYDDREPSRANGIASGSRHRIQAISGPSGSMLGLAPQCSTRRRQFLPK